MDLFDDWVVPWRFVAVAYSAVDLYTVPPIAAGAVSISAASSTTERGAGGQKQSGQYGHVFILDKLGAVGLEPGPSDYELHCLGGGVRDVLRDLIWLKLGNSWDGKRDCVTAVLCINGHFGVGANDAGDSVVLGAGMAHVGG